MSTSAPATPLAARRAPRRPVVPNALLGTTVAVVVEVMLFSGFVSAFLIAKKSLPPVVWPPPDQPRFPVEDTLWNTAALLASGVTCWLAVRALRSGSAWAGRLMGTTFLLGALFVGLQGVEWAQLIRGGLTLRSSIAGAYFYLIVGAHALHAVGGLVAVLWAWLRLRSGSLDPAQASAVRLFWSFVVLLWPILYALVYLS